MLYRRLGSLRGHELARPVEELLADGAGSARAPAHGEEASAHQHERLRTARAEQRARDPWHTGSYALDDVDLVDARRWRELPQVSG